MTELPSSLKERVLHEVKKRSSPTRAEGRARQRFFLALNVVLIGGVSFLQGLPGPSAHRPLAYLMTISGFALASALAASYWMLSSGDSSLGPPRSTLRAMTAVVPIVLVLGAIVSTLLSPESQAVPARAWTAQLMCLGAYLALGTSLLAVTVFGLRPLDPIAPRVTGAAFGATVAAWASLAVGLQCPYPDLAHVLLTHVAPAVLLIALGALWGRRALAIRLASKP